VDFQRVSKDKKIHMKVPLHFVNAEKSPGVKEQAGVVNHVMNELDITCFPDDLPEFIEVDLSNITVGHSVHVRDLPLPKGVEPAIHRNENPVVVTVVIPAIVAEEEEAPAVAAAEVPTTEQAAPAKEGEGAAAADKAGDKGAKAGDKGAKAGDKAPAEKKEKK
jgi:large subunit ribosomal protein L25